MYIYIPLVSAFITLWDWKILSFTTLMLTDSASSRLVGMEGTWVCSCHTCTSKRRLAFSGERKTGSVLIVQSCPRCRKLMELWLIFITFRKCWLLRLYVLAIIYWLVNWYWSWAKLQCVLGAGPSSSLLTVPCPFTVQAWNFLRERGMQVFHDTLLSVIHLPSQTRLMSGLM